MLSEKEIKKLLKNKYYNKEYKFDKKTNQNFIELVNVNFIPDNGFIVKSNNYMFDDQWYVDNYEPILGNQIDYVVDAIKKDPDTRQAFIGMLSPEVYHNGLTICTIGMQVIYDKSKKQIDYIVYMRSNNVCQYPNDLKWQTKILNKILDKLINEVDKNIKIGNIYWNAGSLHIYEEDFNCLLNDE